MPALYILNRQKEPERSACTNMMRCSRHRNGKIIILLNKNKLMAAKFSLVTAKKKKKVWFNYEMHHSLKWHIEEL